MSDAGAGPFLGLFDGPKTTHVTAVEGDDFTMTMSAIFRIGEASGYKNTSEMIDAILAVAAGKPIETLDILDHGRPGEQRVRTDRLTADTLQQNQELRAALARLRGHFATNGRVDLQGCEVAAGPDGARLVRELAKIWGVPVRAGSHARQRPLLPGFEGSTMTCEPPVVDAGGTESQMCRTEEHPIADKIWDGVDWAIDKVRAAF